MSTTEQTATTAAGTLTLWTSDDARITVLHRFGGAEPRIEIHAAGQAQPVQVIKTTRFWRAEQTEAIATAQRLATGAPAPALVEAA